MHVMKMMKTLKTAGLLREIIVELGDQKLRENLGSRGERVIYVSSMEGRKRR